MIVNGDRNFAELTLEQLRDVYTCAITDWCGLGRPGTDEANQMLSDSRAAQVARELAARGIAVDTQTAGFGEALPVDTNATPEGREQNRRVEISLRWLASVG